MPISFGFPSVGEACLHPFTPRSVPPFYFLTASFLVCRALVLLLFLVTGRIAHIPIGTTRFSPSGKRFHARWCFRR